MTSQVHVFEKAGLGIAPFKLVGYERLIFQAYPGAPVQSGGSCDYCSTGIMDAYWIQSSDGRRFKVGCDCVRKTNDVGLRKVVDAKARQVKTEAKAKKDVARIHAAKAALEANQSILTDVPHPSIASKTARDYVEWMLKNAGTTGKIKAAKIIETAICK